MYTPSAFHEDRLDVLQEAIARYPLATLISTAGGDIQASHVPLIYVQSGDKAVLRGHVARANPHCRVQEATGGALAIFTGPQHYISPKWYPSKLDHGKVVPTWNYIVVHVQGRLTFRTDPEWLWQLLEALTDEQEKKLGTGWRVTDAPKEFIYGQLAAIVGVELTVETIQGKWKLSQNRTAADREGVIAGLESVGSESAREMARVMRGERKS
jgi:transcriptional regulator